MLTGLQKQSRGHALVEAFFFRMDRELIEALSKKLNREEKLLSFAAATGIHNPKVLECLVDAGFELSTLTAFTWAPIVFVAWADGHADAAEKQAILDAFLSKGLSRETASMMIAHPWFTMCPTEELWGIWEEFTSTWFADFNEEDREAIFDEIVALCYVVAQASGGFLGIGRVSQAETDAIDRVIKQQGKVLKPSE